MGRSVAVFRWSVALACALVPGSAPLRAQESPIPLDTVHVTISSLASAEMASATRGIEVVSAEEIRALPVRSVPEVLQWALGVDLMPRSPALVDVGLRGSTFEQVLVMVDGVRVSDAQTGHFDLDLAVPLDQVERVEILRGPASTLHGSDAVGGVINLVTRRGGRTLARVEAGTFGTVGGAVTHTIEAGAARVDLGGDVERSDGHRAGTDYETAQGRLSLTAPVGSRTLGVALGRAIRNFGAHGFYGANPDWDEYEKTRATTASVALRAPDAAAVALEPVLSFRRHADDFVLRRDDPSFFRNRHTTDQVGGKVSARYAPGPRVRLAAGAEAFHDRLRSSGLGDRSEERAALLGEVAVGRIGQLSGVAGARIDWHEAHGSFISPALSAGWWPVQGIRIRGSIGRALRTPTWTERYYRDPANVGNENLAPERSWSSEVGIDVTPARGVRLTAAVFERDSEDLIDWARPVEGDEVWVTRNVQSARFRGVEALAEMVDALGIRWSAHGSWISVRSSTPEGMESKYALRPLVESVTVGADHRLGDRLGLSLRATRARRVGEAAYLRADARASLDLSSVRVHLDVRNLGDDDYLDITQIQAPGRSLLLGLQWRQ